MASENEVTTIPRRTLVAYTTYALFPIGGLIAGDLAYATDRLTLYRWSGAAWAAITIYSSSGLAADIPAAATLPNGSLYFETNTQRLKQVQAGAWAALLDSSFPAKLDINAPRYSIPGWYNYNASTNGITSGNLIYLPVYVAETTVYDRIGVQVTIAAAAGKKARLGIQNWANGVPTSLVLDAGTVDIDSIGIKQIVINQSLARGYYALVYVADDTATIYVIDAGFAHAPPFFPYALSLNPTLYNVLHYRVGQQALVAAGLPNPAPGIADLTGGVVSRAGVMVREA